MKKPAPKTVVIDPRAARLAEIDSEIARLQGLVVAKQAALDADVAKMLEDMDHGLQSRLVREIEGIQGKIANFNEKRFAIELHDEIENKAAKPRPSAAASTWKLKEGLQQPVYPTGARAAGRKKDIDAAFDQFRDFGLALSDKHFSKLGAPTDPVDLSLLAVVNGVALGDFLWLSARIAEAEQRLAEMEAAPIKYRGVWQKSDEYKRGHVVTDAGSAWHAIKDIPPGERPGVSDCWQLMVKAGRDARL